MTTPPDRFYFTLGSCSLASLAAMEAAAHPYEPVRLAMSDAGAGDAGFSDLSPLRQVPVLQTAGGPIRETGAILTHLDQAHPAAGLWPRDPAERVPAMRWLGFLGGTLHPAFRLVWRPLRWVGEDAAAQAALRGQAGAYLRRVVAAADAELGGRTSVLAGPSALDFYLHVFTRWLSQGGQPLPPALARHHDAVAALPAMRRAVAVEADTPELAA